MVYNNGGSMKKNTDEVKLENLKNQIDELRETLNELCVTLGENVNSKKRLKLSMYLDELIIEYMRKINK